MLFRFEHHTRPLASRAVFIGRVGRSLLFATLCDAVALAIGMIGYRLTDNLNWIDAFVNAAMILGGMGPVDPLHSDAAKLFAGAYALFCGLLILVAAGIVLAPILHRVLHALHVDDEAS